MSVYPPQDFQLCPPIENRPVASDSQYCCERFSRAAIGGGASSGAQAGQGQGSHADKGDSVTLSGTRHGAAAG